MNIHDLYTEWKTDGFFIDAIDLMKALKLDHTPYETYLQASFLPMHIRREIEYKIDCAYDPNQNVELETQNLQDEQVIQEKPTANSQEPNAIAELRRRAKPLHKLQAHLHEQLRHATTDEERYKIAAKIMLEVVPKLNDLYSKINHWEQTKEVPFVLSTDAEKAVQMMLRLNSLKPRISRLKNWIKSDRIAESKKKEHRIELEEKEAEAEQIRKELNL